MTIIYFICGVITGVLGLLCVCYGIIIKHSDQFDKMVNGHNLNDIMLIDHLKEKVKKLEDLVLVQEKVINVQDLVIQAQQRKIEDDLNVVDETSQLKFGDE